MRLRWRESDETTGRDLFLGPYLVGGVVQSGEWFWFCKLPGTRPCGPRGWRTMKDAREALTLVVKEWAEKAWLGEG